MSETPIKTFDDFVSELQRAGWNGTCDAQHDHISVLWAKMREQQFETDRELAAMTAERDAWQAKFVRRLQAVDDITARAELAELWIDSLEASLQNAAARLHTANVAGAFQSGDELSEYLTKAYEDARRALEHLIWSRKQAVKEGGNG